MSKVVLLSINAKYVHSSLAVWLLCGGVAKYARLPHDVKIVEATINQPDDEIAGRVVVHKPDVVGISTYIWNAGKLPSLLMLLRERLPNAVFVLGGPEASHNAAHWLNHGADYVLRGEGECHFPALLDALDDHDQATLASIPGLWGKQGGQIHVAPEDDSIIDEWDAIDEWIDPYSDAYFDALNRRIAYIETSRGCPFRCAFCLSGGSGVRFLPVDAAKEQLYRLSQSGVQTIKLVDRTFNCNAERAYALFAYIIGLDTACRFHFEVAADLFDARTLSLLATAPPGRIQLEAGLQSFHEPALKAVSRRTDLAKAENNIRALLSHNNIHVHVDLIAGLPFETLSHFQDSFDRAYALGAHTLQLGFLKLLHGSALRAEAEKLGIRYAEDPPYGIIGSPWLSEEDIETLKQTENALRHTYNKGRFLSALHYALSVSGLRPFTLYHALGKAAPNHGTPLVDYAQQIYAFCINLPGVLTDPLRACMIIDWLGMVKGENRPPFLKVEDRRLKQVAAVAEKQLGRRIARHEAAILPSGRGVFVDSGHCDPVTGLYQVHQVY